MFWYKLGERLRLYRVVASGRIVKSTYFPPARPRTAEPLESAPSARDDRFADRYGAYADTRVMAAFGDDFRIVEGAGERATRRQIEMKLRETFKGLSLSTR
jgi:hypothetical protein